MSDKPKPIELLQQELKEASSQFKDGTELHKHILEQAKQDPAAQVIEVDIEEIRKHGNLDFLTGIPEDVKQDLHQQLIEDGILTTH